MDTSGVRYCIDSVQQCPMTDLIQIFHLKNFQDFSHLEEIATNKSFSYSCLESRPTFVLERNYSKHLFFTCLQQSNGGRTRGVNLSFQPTPPTPQLKIRFLEI